MDTQEINPGEVTDMHFHVGLLGDQFPHWGQMSEDYRKELVFRVFLLYGGLEPAEVCDSKLREKTEEVLAGTQLKHVVCLALDPVYTLNGERRTDRSHLWVNNDYILDLQRTQGDKVLLGASVHPYDLKFQERVSKYIDLGAVFLKWLPSAQQIDLAHPKTGQALRYLAHARDGASLPLLLHVGPEYAIPSTDPRTSSYDFLSWNAWNRLRNALRFSNKWFTPDIQGIHANLKAALDEGATIIFAHCGLPYYAPNWLKGILEHSDFKTVKRYLEEYQPGSPSRGTCYADVSACVTPFRRSYYPVIRDLPPGSLLFGSDFPTPVFELSADLEEVQEDFKAVVNGDLDRIFIPEDNLVDVNLRELKHYFPDHPMFTNFNSLLGNK